VRDIKDHLVPIPSSWDVISYTKISFFVKYPNRLPKHSSFTKACLFIHERKIWGISFIILTSVNHWVPRRCIFFTYILCTTSDQIQFLEAWPLGWWSHLKPN